MAGRTSNVFARVEPELKESAEAVLGQLGIPMSNAIGIFLKQVVLQQGLPFPVVLPKPMPVAMGTLSKTELDAVLEKGYQSYLAGHAQSAEAAFTELDREFGL